MANATSASDQVYINVVKQDIVKCDVALKGYLQGIREHSGNEFELNALATIVRNKISQQRTILNILRTLAVEQDSPEGRESALRDVAEHESALHHIHGSLRTALFRAQLAITEREKQELFSTSSSGDTGGEGGQEGVGGARHRMDRNMALKQSSQLTDDLLSVTRMIQDNTDKSTKTLDTLVESSQTIESTQEDLKSMGSVISQARNILSKYGRRENTDKLLIFLGLVFFAACCLVVIRNRLNLF